MSIPLQTCLVCGAVQYPARDVCRSCLSDALELRDTDLQGRVLAAATLHRSLEPERLRHGPLRIGAVCGDLGVRLIVALAPDVHVGARVRLAPSDAAAGPILATPLHEVDAAQAAGPENTDGE